MFLSLYKEFEAINERLAPYFERDHACSLHIKEIESLWKYIEEDDDWKPLFAKLEDIKLMKKAYQSGEGNA